MRLAFALLLSSLAAPALAAAPADDGALETSGVIAAMPDKVFAAFATAEGLESWMVGRARIDLRPGGEMLTRYRKDGALGDDQTIVHTVLAYDPNRLLVLKPARAPAKFPFKDAWLRTWDLIYFTPTPDGGTRVTERMLGFDDSAESRKMRAFFEQGNRATMEQLKKRFERAR